MVRNKYTIKKNNYRRKNKSKFTRKNKRKKNSKKRSKYKRFTRRKYGIKRGGMHIQGNPHKLPPLGDAHQAAILGEKTAGKVEADVVADNARRLVDSMDEGSEVKLPEIPNTQKTPDDRATATASLQTSDERMTGTTGAVPEQSDIETKWTAMSYAHNIHLEELRMHGIIITNLLNDKEIITTLTGLGIIKGNYSSSRKYKDLKQIVKDYNTYWRKRDIQNFLKEYIYVGDIYIYLIGSSSEEIDFVISNSDSSGISHDDIRQGVKRLRAQKVKDAIRSVQDTTHEESPELVGLLAVEEDEDEGEEAEEARGERTLTHNQKLLFDLRSKPDLHRDKPDILGELTKKKYESRDALQFEEASQTEASQTKAVTKSSSKFKRNRADVAAAAAAAQAKEDVSKDKGYNTLLRLKAIEFFKGESIENLPFAFEWLVHGCNYRGNGHQYIYDNLNGLGENAFYYLRYMLKYLLRVLLNDNFEYAELVNYVWRKLRLNLSSLRDGTLHNYKGILIKLIIDKIEEDILTMNGSPDETTAQQLLEIYDDITNIIDIFFNAGIQTGEQLIITINEFFLSNKTIFEKNLKLYKSLLSTIRKD